MDEFDVAKIRGRSLTEIANHVHERERIIAEIFKEIELMGVRIDNVIITRIDRTFGYKTPEIMRVELDLRLDTL